MPKEKFTHLDNKGKIRMVNIGGKKISLRTARAEAVVLLGKDIAEKIQKNGTIAKGNVIETARLAGIMAAKRTSENIPLCHQIPLDWVDINAKIEQDLLRLESIVCCRHYTGVEMEALSAVAIAALTVYDMCKSAGKGIVIERIRLLEKTGGKSGNWFTSKK